MRSTSSLAFAGLLGSAHAFWRMECPGRVGLARIDPLVNPGVPANHAHAIHGSSAFTETAGSADLMAGDCTSCRVTEDLSAYWHPAVYFEHDSGEFELVPQVGGMLAYYLLFGDNITAFPEGFEMMSGDTNRRKYTLGDPNEPDPEKSTWASLGQTKQSDLAQRALGFNCLNYDRDPEGTLYRHKLPDKEFLDANCKDGVRFELMFPSCWNGEDLSSPDHKSHVAFPNLVMTGDCPEDFPVRVPSLLYEVIWDTNSFKDKSGRFVMANGDPTGLGYHGDFITGWKPEFLQSAVDECTSPSGRIEDCPVFNVVDEAEAKSCSISKGMSIMSENVTGPMKSLPGNVKITTEEGSEKGSDNGGESASKPPKPTSASMTYAPGELPSNPAAPLPGQVFKESGLGDENQEMTKPAEAEPTTEDAIQALAAPEPAPAEESSVEQPPAAEPPAEEPPAPTSAPAEAPEPTGSFFKTEYITNGNVVSMILWEEELVTVTEQIDATTTVVLPPAATEARRRRHLLGHGHRHF